MFLLKYKLHYSGFHEDMDYNIINVLPKYSTHNTWFYHNNENIRRSQNFFIKCDVKKKKKI